MPFINRTNSEVKETYQSYSYEVSPETPKTKGIGPKILLDSDTPKLNSSPGILSRIVFWVSHCRVAQLISVLMSKLMGSHAEAYDAGFQDFEYDVQFSPGSSQDRGLSESLGKAAAMVEKFTVEQQQQYDEVAQVLNVKGGEMMHEAPVLADGDLDSILRLVDQTKAKLDALLEAVQSQAAQDLYLDEEYIKKKFNVEDLLTSLSPKDQKARRQMLQKIINEAYVNRELKQKTGLVGSERQEQLLLDCLGFDVGPESNYQNKQAVYDILQEVVHQQLSKEFYSGPLSVVKKSLKICALQARLSAAGLTPLQVKKFQSLLNEYPKSKSELEEAHKDITLEFPADIPLEPPSLTCRYLRHNFNAIKKKYVDEEIKVFFSHNDLKIAFDDESVSAAEFDRKLMEGKGLLNKDKVRDKCTAIMKKRNGLAKEMLFYQKWGQYIKIEFIQGFLDEQEDLGTGVCWALNHRVVFEAQQKPEMTLEEFSSIFKITKNDRFTQTLIQHKLSQKLPYESPNYLSEHGYHDKPFHFDEYKGQQLSFDWLRGESWEKASPKSSGWVKLMLSGKEDSGHTFAVRWDAERHQYWVVDSNMALFCFDASSNEKEAQQKCHEFLRELVATYYPKTQVLAVQSVRG